MPNPISNDRCLNAVNFPGISKTVSIVRLFKRTLSEITKIIYSILCTGDRVESEPDCAENPHSGMADGEKKSFE